MLHLLHLLLLLLVHMRVFVAHQVSKTAQLSWSCVWRQCAVAHSKVNAFVSHLWVFFFSSPVLPAMCGEQSSCGKKRREKEKQDAERMLQTRAERSSEPGPYREKQAERLWAAAAAAGAERCSAHTPRDHRGQPAVWSTDGHKQRAERTRWV